MTALSQSVRQAVQLHGIAAEAVRRVERGQVQKTQGTAHSNNILPCGVRLPRPECRWARGPPKEMKIAGVITPA
jgi:hypothetical protein